MKSLLTLGLLSIMVCFLQAQNEPTPDHLDIFLDCPTCDMNYIRTNLDFVNHANDPAIAQVHILVSVQGTGSGGALHQLDFVGKDPFNGDRITLDFQAEATMTNLERQEGLVRTLKLGLVPFMAQTRMAKQVDLQFKKNNAANAPTEPLGKGKKPFDNWIFEVFNNLNWDKESLRSTVDWRYGLSADYVTPEWRVRIDPSFYYQERVVKTDEKEIRSYRRQNAMYWSVVKSLGEHWSVGFFDNITSSTYNNVKLGVWVSPAIEYSILPYSEVVTRELTVGYHLGQLHNRYIEETIFLKTEETILSHYLDFQFRLRQRWGDVNMFLQGSCFLDDWSRNHLSLNGRVGVRVVKGLSFNMGGSFRIVNDQVSLPRGNISLEDILLGQRQLATNFDSNLNFGVRYTFGALYNNVVNTRL
jgi:hypothetical protein